MERQNFYIENWNKLSALWIIRKCSLTLWTIGANTSLVVRLDKVEVDNIGTTAAYVAKNEMEQGQHQHQHQKYIPNEVN